jgi:nitrite reductase/ring-hydroxylating ferredoxin subunit
MPQEMDFEQTGATTHDAVPIDICSVDGKQFARVHVGGKALLLPPRCPHRGAPISEEGRVVGNFIVCGRHGATFDLRTGKWLRGPPCKDINILVSPTEKVDRE